MIIVYLHKVKMCPHEIEFYRKKEIIPKSKKKRKEVQESHESHKKQKTEHIPPDKGLSFVTCYFVISFCVRISFNTSPVIGRAKGSAP